VIADDSQQMCDLLQIQLNAIDDIEVVGCANNGEETISLIDEIHPDVLLLDLILPRLDGVAVLERLTRMEKRPEIMILSALAGRRSFRRSPIRRSVLHGETF
jgi:two-component system response regulator (stage 0 sporulation protein A)